MIQVQLRNMATSSSLFPPASIPGTNGRMVVVAKLLEE